MFTFKTSFLNVNIFCFCNSFRDSKFIIDKLFILEISKINNFSIINFKSLKELQKQNIISFKDNVLKVNKKYMIKLNSILDYLINH